MANTLIFFAEKNVRIAFEVNVIQLGIVFKHISDMQKSISEMH